MVKVNKKLFWDVNIENLDYEKHADFIIKRVLQYGDKKDYQIVKTEYGIEKIKQIAQKAPLDKKSLNFWGIVFNLPLNSFYARRSR